MLENFHLYNSKQINKSSSNNKRRSNNQLSYIRWLCPLASQVKLNSDGSLLHQLMAVCADVLRDDSGSLIRAFAANSGCCPVAVAELWGAFYALDLAWSLGLKKTYS